MSSSRPFIVVGDKTDRGGEVLEGSPKAFINDKMIARMGDKGSCPRCSGNHTIVDGDPTVIVDGRPAAYHGGKTSCGAVLTASQMDNTMGGSAGAPLPPERDWSAAPAAATPPATYAAPDAGEPGFAPENQPTRASEAEIQQYMRAHHKKRTFTQEQNTNLAISRKAIQIVREGKTVTLKARVPVFGVRAKDFSAAVMTRWNGLSFTDENGITYKSDIRVMSTESEKDAIIRLQWGILPDDIEQGMPNGTILLNRKKNEEPIHPGVAAHEFGHAFFGLKDGYYNHSFYIRKDVWVTDPALPGMEGSIMANSARGVVRPQDLKVLIEAYGSQLQ